MSNLGIPVALFAVLVIVPACGCSPDPADVYEPSAEARAFAQKLCSTRHECGCDDERFASYSECVGEISKSFDGQIDAGAQISKSCFDDALANESLNGCPPWVWSEDLWSCAVLKKSKKLGDPCSPTSGLAPLVVEECDTGLYCSQSKCRPVEEAGQPPSTIPEVGDPCTSGADCGGMYCGVDRHCQASADLGGQCDHPFGCKVPGYCEGLGGSGSGICALPRQPGEACDPRDWAACSSPEFPELVNACDADTNTCVPDQPGICRLTHPLIATL